MTCLIVDPDPATAQDLAERFHADGERRVEISVTVSLEACLERLKASRPDAVLLEPDLPDSAGLTTVSRVVEAAGAIPVLVVSGPRDETLASDVLALGAQDYVCKDDLDRENLPRIVRYAIERQSLHVTLRRNLFELERTQMRFRSLIVDNADAILIIDEGGRVKFANPAAEKLLMMPMTRLVDQQFGVPVDGVDEPELDLLRDDGTRGIVSMRFMQTLWDGRPAYITTLRDISERKTAERALEVAKQRAEEANHMKSQFLANMSHELRTPLNSILGFSELMQIGIHGTLGHSRYGDYVANIRQSGVHLLSLINDLLDLSKIEAGALTLDQEEFELVTVIVGVVESLRPRAAQGELSFETDLGPPGLWVRADQRHVRQILLNLVSNAIKFTMPGGRITVAIDWAEDGSLVLSVRDTGIGIPTESIPKALAPFCQVENAYARGKGEGTGLGLALSKRMAELHGGSLKLESVEGEGTTVLVSLPAHRVVQTGESETVGRKG